MLDKIIAAAPGISAVVAALTFAVAIATFIKAIIEYTRQNAVKRFEKFQEINKRFDEHAAANIRMLLEGDSAELIHVPYQDKHDFLGLYEEVAIMVNSKIMRKWIAYYMCGYYAILCSESTNFWLDDDDGDALERNSPFWSLFNKFADDMRAIRDNLDGQAVKPRKLRF
jgi:hypothetical protein